MVWSTGRKICFKYSKKTTHNSTFFDGKQQIRRQTASSAMQLEYVRATEYCGSWW